MSGSNFPVLGERAAYGADLHCFWTMLGASRVCDRARRGTQRGVELVQVRLYKGSAFLLKRRSRSIVEKFALINENASKSVAWPE